MENCSEITGSPSDLTKVTGESRGHGTCTHGQATSVQVLVPGSSDLLPTSRPLALRRFRRRGESRTQVYCRKFGKNCSTKEKSKLIKGHIHFRAYSPNGLAALPPERPYNSTCHQPCVRGFWSMSRPSTGLQFF